MERLALLGQHMQLLRAEGIEPEPVPAIDYELQETIRQADGSELRKYALWVNHAKRGIGLCNDPAEDIRRLRMAAMDVLRNLDGKGA